MFKPIATDELVELNCMTWWSDKKGARRLEKAANAEEFLPSELDNHNRMVTVPPDSVFFAVELA